MVPVEETPAALNSGRYYDTARAKAADTNTTRKTKNGETNDFSG